MTRRETDHDGGDDREEGAASSDDAPVVLSPGDSDAPDAPDPATVYPDKQGAPGDPDD